MELTVNSVDVPSARHRLQRYVSSALFRLRLQEGLNAFMVVLHLAAWLLVVCVFADRVFSLKLLGIDIWVVWGAACVLGLPYILWRAFTPRINQQLAAVMTDDRLGLHARLCSALTLDIDDPNVARFSEAFFGEAVNKLHQLDVTQAFPIKSSRAHVLLLVPLLIAGALFQFMPYKDVLNLVSIREEKRRADERRERAAKSVESKLEDLKHKLEDNKLDDNAQYKVEQLMQKADDIVKELKEGKRSADEAMVALGQLKREMQKEKDKIADGKEFLDRLEKLQAKDLNLEDGDLTKDVSEALKMGDPGEAAREMRRLSQKIKQDILDNPNKTDAQKKAELDQLKREIEKLAGALAEDEALREGLQELSEKAMESAEFQQLQQAIKDRMEKDGKGSKKLGGEIDSAVEEIASELERLEEENDLELSENEENEMEALDEAEESIEEAMEEMAEESDGQEGQEGKDGKDGKSGKAGDKGGKSGKSGKASKTGKGGKSGKGSRPGRSMKARSGGKKSGQSGGKNSAPTKGGGPGGEQSGEKGHGNGGGERGQGSGRRGYQDGDAKFEEQKVKGKLQAGAITGLSHFRGQGAKGNAPMQFKEALEAAEQEAQSSLELERIPVDAREVVKDYFSRVKEGAGIQGKP